MRTRHDVNAGSKSSWRRIQSLMPCSTCRRSCLSCQRSASLQLSLFMASTLTRRVVHMLPVSYFGLTKPILSTSLGLNWHLRRHVEQINVGAGGRLG